LICQGVSLLLKITAARVATYSIACLPSEAGTDAEDDEEKAERCQRACTEVSVIFARVYLSNRLAKYSGDNSRHLPETSAECWQ
jgi:hypothetical protein